MNPFFENVHIFSSENAFSLKNMEKLKIYYKDFYFFEILFLKFYIFNFYAAVLEIQRFFR